MSTPSREELSERTKEELLDYIEQQADQLGRFEARFRDVVRAYKGQLKEKEALEASLRAISGQKSAPEGTPSRLEGLGSRPEGSEGGQSEGEESTTGTAEANVSHTKEETDEHKEHVAQLQQQISTLTTALATLTEERAKMETSFQEDKKTLLGQQDALVRQMQLERETAEGNIRQLQNQLEDTQYSLSMEKRSRERDENNSAEMLKELQILIASERNTKETIAAQLQDAERELLRLNKQDRTYEYEERVQSLSIELEGVRSRLQVAERRAAQPSAFVLRLQSEMATMKEEHRKSLMAEQTRANEAEERLQIQAQMRANEAEERLQIQAQRDEQKVASLESKLTELSETVGNYDRQREQDTIAIQKLKERVTQLDSENTALTRAHIEREGSVNNDTAEQLAALQEKVARLKAFLKIATVKISEMTALPSNVEELSISDYAELLANEPSRKDYQQELHQLKDEFERYKTRAQSVLKGRGNKEVEATSKEVKELRTRNNELQSKLDALQSQYEEEEEVHLLQTQKLRLEMREMHDKHKQHEAMLEAQHKQKLRDLHQHFQTTRERSIKLLAEKDSELHKLRSDLQVLETHTSYRPRTERSISYTSNVSQSDGFNENGNHDDSLNLSRSDSTGAVQELLEQPSPAAANEGRLLHFVQEQHRRDNELATARRKRLELEEGIRELREREQRHVEQNALLKQEIRKLERDRSRETENLEYLKNVIIHYMCSDSSGQEQMINAIATILHFSPDELRLPLSSQVA